MTYTDYNINVNQNKYERFWPVSCKKDFWNLNISIGKYKTLEIALNV